MRIMFIGLSVVFGLSACAMKDVQYYDRANSASAKSLDGLDRDIK